jgi:peptidoglycan/xylan/chitin deacetylase (PgdA/CDA1 family)
MYLVKTPFWLRALYPACTWKMPSTDKVIYLSFDDGPHPEATPFVLVKMYFLTPIFMSKFYRKGM